MRDSEHTTRCPECGSKALLLSMDKPGDPMDGMKRTVCTKCDYIVGDYSEECDNCNVVVSVDGAKLGDFWARVEYHKRFECAKS